MADIVNCDGTPIFSKEKDPQRWKDAVDACQLLIDEAEDAGHKLHMEYLTDGTTIDPFLSYQNALLKRKIEGNMKFFLLEQWIQVDILINNVLHVVWD